MDINILKNKTFEAWVPFGDDTEILISHVSRDELQKIAKIATKTTYKNHQKTEEPDPAEADRLLGRRAVKGWQKRGDGEGFTDNGQPFPYTPENTDLLMAKWNAFARFVNDTCIDLETLVKYEREQVIKK